MTIYELTAEYDRLQNLIMSDDEDTALEAWDALTITEESIKAKADAYAKMIKNLSAEATAYKAEADRLTQMRKSRENAVDRLKKLMQDAMIVMGKDKVETTIGKFSISPNPASCHILNAESIPAEYLIPQDPKVDSKGIIQHFKQTGEQISGTEVIQEMGLRFR